VKKSELRTILKPLIKECIKEIIFEDGTLSGIISEVVQGLQGNTKQSIVETKVIKSSEPTDAVIEARKSLEDTKRQLQESTGLKGIFESTNPLRSGGSPNTSQQGGALRDLDPRDPGVDISGIMKVAGGTWNQIK